MNDEASATLDEGTEAGETARRYLQLTVLLATVLFLIAQSHRFKQRNVRIGLLIVAGAPTIIALATVVTLPRL